MIHLGTMILSSWGNHMVPLGKFLHVPDRPSWNQTVDINGELAKIRAATVVDAEDLGQQALCLVVTSREKQPVIGEEGTRVWSLDREGWVPFSKLNEQECIRIPDITPHGTVVTWGRVKRVVRAPLPERLFMDANKMWGRMVLERGSYSFATPAAFLHQ